MADQELDTKAREMSAARYERSAGGSALRVVAVLVILGAIVAVVIGLSQDDKRRDATQDAPKPGAKDAPKVDATKTEYAKVRIAGKEFKLELVMTAEKRHQGLSGRTDIPADGGMLFVFTDAQVDVHNFVMRDCPVPIDIIYLDKAARVTASHKMKIEPPRTEAEKKLDPPTDRQGKAHPEAPRWMWSNDAYEDRLKKYTSKFDSQFVIELKGDTLDTLKIKEGDKVELVGSTWEALKKRAE